MIKKAAIMILGSLLLIGSSLSNLSSAGDSRSLSLEIPATGGQVECSPPSEYNRRKAQNVFGRWMNYLDQEGSIDDAQIVACSEALKKTQTPTVSPVITGTATPTNTPSPTPTPLTPTPTHFVASRTPSITPRAQQCGQIDIVDAYVGLFGYGYYGVVIQIQNVKSASIYLNQAHIVWYEDIPERMLWAMQFNLSDWVIFDDIESPTTWNPSPVIELVSGTVGAYNAIFKPADEPLIGPGKVDLTFDDSCVISFQWDMPKATPSPTDLLLHSIAPIPSGEPTDG